MSNNGQMAPLAPPRRILAGCDFGPHGLTAVTQAISLARAHGASLSILHVVDHLESEFNQVDLRERLRPLLDKIKGEAAQRLEQLYLPALGGVDSRIHVSVGRPSREILSQAESEGADLIVIGAADGRSRTRLFGLGSTADQVVRRSPAHVLVMRGAGVVRFRQVLAPVDFSPSSVDSVRYSLALLGQDQPMVSLLHVISLVERISHKALPEKSPERIELIRAVEAGSTQAFEHLLQQVDAPADRITTEIRRGDPARMILQAVKDQQADLLVMSAKGRGAVGAVKQFLVGSTLLRVLRKLPCPLLAVKA